MNNLNPIIRVIEHIKEHRLELKEEIEELRDGVIISNNGFYIQLKNYKETVICKKDFKIIGNLDFLILSKALGNNYCIQNGVIATIDINLEITGGVITLPPLHLWTEETADTIIGLIN